MADLFSNLFVNIWATKRNKIGDKGHPWWRPPDYEDGGAKVAINICIVHTPVEGHIHQFNEIISKPHRFHGFKKKVMLESVECFFKIDLEKKAFLFRVAIELFKSKTHKD